MKTGEKKNENVRKTKLRQQTIRINWTMNVTETESGEHKNQSL